MGDLEETSPAPRRLRTGIGLEMRAEHLADRAAVFELQLIHPGPSWALASAKPASGRPQAAPGRRTVGSACRLSPDWKVGVHALSRSPAPAASDPAPAAERSLLFKLVQPVRRRSWSNARDGRPGDVEKRAMLKDAETCRRRMVHLSFGRGMSSRTGERTPALGERSVAESSEECGCLLGDDPGNFDEVVDGLVSAACRTGTCLPRSSGARSAPLVAFGRGPRQRGLLGVDRA